MVSCACVVVVPWHSAQVELGGTNTVVVVPADCVVLVDVLGDLVVVVALTVVVVTGVFEPQNFTFEMSGVLPCPTGGRPWFENEPVTCGGLIEDRTEAGPPFTMIAEIGVVDAHQAPSDDSCDSVTTCSLPCGPSKS